MKKPTDEDLVQIAFGEVRIDEAEMRDEDRERMEVFCRTVRDLEQAYASNGEDRADLPPLGEFQRERLDAARRRVSPMAGRKTKQVWMGWAAAAAVVALMAGSYVFRNAHAPDTGGGPLVSNGNVPEDKIGIRSGKAPVPVPEGEVSATILAPVGEVEISAPVLFIWKSDPRLKWDLELYRSGDSQPLAKASGVSVPFPAEKLTDGVAATIWQEGGSFRWVMKASGKEETTASGEFRLAAGAPSLAGAGSADIMQAVEEAEKAGRLSEALMLLFSIHDQIPVDDFIAKRRALEEKIVNR